MGIYIFVNTALSNLYTEQIKIVNKLKDEI